MASVAQRWDEWLDLVSGLAAHPSPTFPRAEVGRQLAESFATRVSWSWIDSGAVGSERRSSPDMAGSPATRSVVLTESGTDYCDEDVELARLIQPLLALLARQVDLLNGLGCPEASGAGLTAREVVVLRLLSEGRTAVSIAHALRVSPRTVHTHLSHVYRKLGVCDRMGAVLTAQELGVLK